VVRTYTGPVADSRRWAGFEHRAGDIVISTPSKCGTTWTQMLVALLVFDGPEFPDRLGVVSPWIENEFTPVDEICQRLMAQQHRRFIKTHTPLDGFDLDDRVHYVIVGRDPRDVFLSMQQHSDNLNFERMMPILMRNVGPEEMGRRVAAVPPYETFAEAIELPAGDCLTSVEPAHVLGHLYGGWERGDQPNVTLLHYADLKVDLPGELARLAAALGFDYPTQRIGELAAFADFANMREHAEELTPEAHHGAWKSETDFFRTARLGAWAEAFDRDVLLRYEERVTELISDEEFLAWAHRGHQGGDWRIPGRS
jgi:hypothetical protein